MEAIYGRETKDASRIVEPSVIASRCGQAESQYESRKHESTKDTKKRQVAKEGRKQELKLRKIRISITKTQAGNTRASFRVFVLSYFRDSVFAVTLLRWVIRGGIVFSARIGKIAQMVIDKPSHEVLM